MNKQISFLLLLTCTWMVACQPPGEKQEITDLFNAQCASCHANNSQSRAPSVVHLGSMSPRSIVAALESGRMQMHGDSLSRDEKVALAEYLTNKKLVDSRAALNFCALDPNDSVENDVKYFGWAGNLAGTGFVTEEVAGLTVKDIPHLRLKWAFGFDGGTVTRTKSTVIGNSIVFGSQFGEVYSLDMKSGCVRWMFEADANVRGGIAVNAETSDIVLFIADFNANVYALQAATGDLLWRTATKDDPNNAVTGTPVYYDGLVYVPLTSMEVVTAGDDAYECCKASGQVVAVNATTGSLAWRHRVIQEKATERGVNTAGAKMFGPSGAPVWSSPTVDTVRGYLYIGTGENNSNPTTTTSDALQALDLKTGELIWNFQATPRDAYISACSEGGGANCPDPPGPDVDFGMAPILTSRPDGSDVLVVGQKSGVVHCLNPDSGELIWQTRVGRGGALGGIHWGMTTDGEKVYAANSDWLAYGGEGQSEANPGIFALDLMTGEVLWQAKADPAICEGVSGCYSTFSAAPTMIADAVFAPGLDGYLRVFSAVSGDLIWSYNTSEAFHTVNQVAAHGGAMDGPGPVIADGMVFVNSGYALFGQMPGNVLLAFSKD